MFYKAVTGGVIIKHHQWTLFLTLFQYLIFSTNSGPIISTHKSWDNYTKITLRGRLSPSANSTYQSWEELTLVKPNFPNLPEVLPFSRIKLWTIVISFLRDPSTKAPEFAPKDIFSTVRWHQRLFYPWQSYIIILKQSMLSFFENWASTRRQTLLWP